MTVAELRAKLAEYPDDQEVVYWDESECDFNTSGEIKTAPAWFRYFEPSPEMVQLFELAGREAKGRYYSTSCGEGCYPETKHEVVDIT